MRKNSSWLHLLIGYPGVLLGTYGVVAFNRFVLGSLPLGGRMIGAIAVYWLIAAVPLLLLLLQRETLSDYGFCGDRIGRQILTGIILGFAMSLVLTLLPHLLGFGAYVDSGKRYRFVWQFAYEFVFCIFAVGFAEKLVFRGILYGKLRAICPGEGLAVLVSSVLFGAFHLFGGDPVQMIVTGCIGALLCFCRMKIRNCSVVSLAIAHGIYDALITVWASLLL